LDALVGETKLGISSASKSIVDAWGATGVATGSAHSNANHFTAIAPLADANSTMVAR